MHTLCDKADNDKLQRCKWWFTYCMAEKQWQDLSASCIGVISLINMTWNSKGKLGVIVYRWACPEFVPTLLFTIFTVTCICCHWVSTYAAWGKLCVCIYLVLSYGYNAFFACVHLSWLVKYTEGWCYAQCSSRLKTRGVKVWPIYSRSGNFCAFCVFVV